MLKPFEPEELMLPIRKMLEGRLAKLQNLHGRGSCAVASSGTNLEGDQILHYIKKVQKRIDIIDFLSETSR